MGHYRPYPLLRKLTVGIYEDMTKTISYAAITAFLSLAPSVSTPYANETAALVTYSITDWLSCSERPQLPWCN